MLRPRSGLPFAARGVTLIEIAIGLVIIALTITFGLPGMAEWLQNAQIRNAAEAVKNGLQVARAEAVRRNTHVEFTLTNPGNTAGTGWRVRIVGTGAVFQSKPDGEGSASVVLTAVPGGSNTVTFNGFGRTPTTPANNDDGSAFMTQIDVDSATLAAADSREMRILVSSGGQIRMCDPNVAAATDSRSC